MDAGDVVAPAGATSGVAFVVATLVVDGAVPIATLTQPAAFTTLAKVAAAVLGSEIARREPRRSLRCGGVEI